MDVGRGISAPFKDSNWLMKALIGGVWSVVPFTGFALTGYYLDYIRNTAHGRETPLPEWSLFGRFWIRGLLAAIAIFIYMLPAFALIMLAALPLIPIAIVSDSRGMQSGGGLEALFAGGLCLAIGVALIYMLAIWIFVAAALAHYAMHEEFSTAFAFRDIKQRLSTPGASYATALVMSIAIAVVAGVFGSTVGAILAIVPLLGWLAAIFLSGAVGFVGSLMAAHLFGQYAARAYGLPGPDGAPSGYSPPGTMPAPPPTEPSAPVSSPPSPPAAPEAPETPQAPEAPPIPPTPPKAPEASGPAPEAGQHEESEGRAGAEEESERE